MLHRVGKPGAVVGHRATQSRRAIRESPTERDARRLLNGDVVSVMDRLQHPEDFLAFMLKAVNGEHGNSELGVWRPHETHLTILQGRMSGGANGAHVMGSVLQAAKRAKAQGLIGDYEVVRSQLGHVPMVAATDGRVHQVPINKIPIKYLDRFANTDWEE